MYKIQHDNSGLTHNTVRVNMKTLSKCVSKISKTLYSVVRYTQAIFNLFLWMQYGQYPVVDFRLGHYGVESFITSVFILTPLCTSHTLIQWS